jgi:acyl carrier protein
MWFGGNGPRTLKSPSGMTRAEIASAVEQIVAAVADEYGLVEAKDAVTLRSSLHDDLGMDEVDLIEVVFRAEERFRVSLPDDDIGLSSTVSDIVARIAARLREQEAPSRAPAITCWLEAGSGQGGFQLETDGFQQQGMRAVDDARTRPSAASRS